MWYKISPEIRMNFENKPWEIRWRPDDHIILPQYYKEYIGKPHIGRTDIMLGVNFSDFKLFIYSKFDDIGRMWTGIRFDYNTSIFNNKLLINIQERLFFGLNIKSANHYYLIQYIRYLTSKKHLFGILSYGKWEFQNPFTEEHWFIGPSADFRVTKNINFQVALTKSIFYNNTYMTFIRLGYKINIKNKKDKE
jgi:hypothetical protein